MSIDASKDRIVDFLKTRRGSSPAGSLWAHWLQNDWDQRLLEPALGSLALDGRVSMEDGLLRLAPEHGTVEAKVCRHLAAAWAGLDLASRYMRSLEDSKRDSLEVAFEAEIPEISIADLHSSLQRFLERAFAILSVGPEET